VLFGIFSTCVAIVDMLKRQRIDISLEALKVGVELRHQIA
jgi:hypothetical protein